ncbi:sugar ABC transporter permease [Paenibacillus psychroresistens]|uniref:Sugar ABC transporter permease n=1 Tax=Paenibacillus psychroresistens TaxID=1778678 RepID=A0A6B8RSK4_9BACL|nr:sugar ABC transporter permease [Paenibacillus psychroresistens]QGQ99410.1 sugar ABC transporter permease [Paenibacillus psychroresistens]
MNTKKIYSAKFLILALLFYSILVVLPSFIGIFYSFTDWNSMNSVIHFIGLDNYKEIFFSDDSYMPFVWRSINFGIITTVCKALIGLALALLLNSGLKSQSVLRAVFFMPVTISPLIIGLLFIAILNPTNGLVNGFFHGIGLDFLAKPWLADPKWSFLSVMSVEVWRYAGFNMAIFLAGMQMIPKSDYEAASLDGAGAWAKFIHITLPYLLPSIAINTIFNLINGLKVFDIVFALTHGGPGRSTEVMNTMIFKTYSSGLYGLSTAMGVVMFLLIMIIAFTVLKLLTRKEEAF